LRNRETFDVSFQGKITRRGKLAVIDVGIYDVDGNLEYFDGEVFWSNSSFKVITKNAKEREFYEFG